MIARGAMLGPDQPVILHMLDIEPAKTVSAMGVCCAVLCCVCMWRMGKGDLYIQAVGVMCNV